MRVIIGSCDEEQSSAFAGPTLLARTESKKLCIHIHTKEKGCTANYLNIKIIEIETLVMIPSLSYRYSFMFFIFIFFTLFTLAVSYSASQESSGGFVIASSHMLGVILCCILKVMF